jgi:acyl-coenzyme A thioesterase PaaI-like protein
MIEVENDPDNPCFGCGPNNIHGLNLKFLKVDDNKIIAEKTFDERYSAWTGQVHGGIVFAALECTCQWTFYATKGRVGPTESFGISFPSRVLVGEPTKLIGTAMRETPETVSIKAELVQSGQVRAIMDQDIRVVHSREEFARLRPAVKLDPVMERNLPI